MNPTDGSPIDHELFDDPDTIILQENDQRSLEAGYFTPDDFEHGGEG